jgi:mitochondrial fission protein ELM1
MSLERGSTGEPTVIFDLTGFKSSKIELFFQPLGDVLAHPQTANAEATAPPNFFPP